MYVTGADVISVKGASLVFLTRWNRDMDTGQLLSERTGWWICCLIVFVMSTSGWDLIGMATYLQTSQMDTLFLCMCECKYSVALHWHWIDSHLVLGEKNLEVKLKGYTIK